jgi:peptidyl-prolyl cis-trans isomerase C
MEVGEDVLVTIDGHKVTQKMLEVGLGPMPEAERKQFLENPERKRELVERMAFAEMLYQKAVTAKMQEDPKVKDALALVQREILANLMLEKMGDEAATDQAIEEKYKSMAVQFNRPSAQVHHILVQRQDEANQLVEQIKGGQIDFLDAAKKFSIDRNVGQNGGDLGWTVRAPISELQDAWANAPVGEIVGPVEGRLGFHILRVVGRRDSTPLEEVKDRLRDMVKSEAMKNARRDMMAQADITWADGTKGINAGPGPGEAPPGMPMPPGGAPMPPGGAPMPPGGVPMPPGGAPMPPGVPAPGAPQ